MVKPVVQVRGSDSQVGLECIRRHTVLLDYIVSMYRHLV